MRRAAHVAAAAWLLVSASAHAADDADLIPDTLRTPQPAVPSGASPQPSGWQPRVHVEDALTVSTAQRALAVPSPSPSPDWQNRTSADAIVEWTPRRPWRLTLSDRIDVLEQDGVSLASRQTVQNELREAYATYEVVPKLYLEAGRINVRNGVALGYSPADLFRARTLVGQASLDPSVLRQNRLGALMARAEVIWDGGSSSVAVAPGLFSPRPVVSSDPLGVDPRFDATNGAMRALCTVGFDLLGLSPVALGYFEQGRSKLGLELTYPVGSSWVTYGEWTAGPESNLIARAAAFGVQTGTLPAGAPILPPTDTGRAVRNDASVGASYTPTPALTINLEYHLHQSGLSRADLRSWFDLGSAAAAPPAVPGELWYLRAYAADQQEPVPMHELFVRAAWTRMFDVNLEVSGFAFVDLLDGSTLAQVGATYSPSDTWSVAVFGSANLGGERTERGSAPQLATGIAEVMLYL